MLKRIAARSAADKSLSSKPPTEMSLDEKKLYWLKKLLELIRQTGGVANDFLQVFSRSNYERWKEEEDDIDEILDYVVAALDSEYEAEGSIEEEINRRIKEVELG